MELIDKIKIKRSDNFFYKILIIICYPFLLIFGLIVMLFAGIISIFQKKEIEEKTPKLFISGHSHILKAMYDQKNQLLHLNPGAMGKVGWHQMRTMMRFEIIGNQIENLEIVELGKK